MSNVNITILRPEGYIFSSAFIEVVKYLHFYIEKLGHNAVVTENRLEELDYNIVFGAHLLTYLSHDLPRRTIIFNTEPMPLSQKYWRNDSINIYKDLMQRYPTWDYSSFNKLSGNIQPFNTIPLLFCPVLREYNNNSYSNNGLLFYGELTRRRQRIIDDLIHHGVEVQTITGDFGAVRNLAILQSRAVLNLHKHESPAVLETVRCFYPLNCGVPVITEEYIKDPTIGAYQDFVFEMIGGDFTANVCSLLRSYRYFNACSSAMITRFRESDPTNEIAAAVELSFRF